MEHAKDIDLIELAANRLDAGREAALRRHLDDCPVCREKLEDLRRTWDLLGAWEVQPAGHLDVSRVVADAGGAVRPHVIRLPGATLVLRFAAAAAVTVFVAYMGGRWSVRTGPVTSGAEPPQYVSALGLELGESLSPLVLQDELPAQEEG